MDTQKKKEFDIIYKRNIDTVYAIAFLHLKNTGDAEDASQSVFMKYLTSGPVFNDLNHEKAWFITTVRNHCRNMISHWWNARRTAEAEEEKCFSVFADEPDGKLTEKLMKLPEKYRDLIYLYYYEEYTVKEISAVTGINESTVRTQLQRAREKLRKLLDKEENVIEKSEIIRNV